MRNETSHIPSEKRLKDFGNGGERNVCSQIVMRDASLTVLGR